MKFFQVPLADEFVCNPDWHESMPARIGNGKMTLLEKERENRFSEQDATGWNMGTRMCDVYLTAYTVYDRKRHMTK